MLDIRVSWCINRNACLVIRISYFAGEGQENTDLHRLTLINAASIKSYIPFSPQVCGGLVLYFSFTPLSIVLGLLFEPLHSGLFIFLYRHLYRRTLRFSGGALRRPLYCLVKAMHIWSFQMVLHMRRIWR